MNRPPSASGRTQQKSLTHRHDPLVCMNKVVECPICEAEISVPDSSNASIRCPECDRKFKITDVMMTSVPAAANGRRVPTLATPAPTGVRQSKKFKELPDQDSATSRESPKSPDQEGLEQSASEFEANVSEKATNEASLLEVRQRYRRKNRNRTFVAVAFALVFALVIGGLAAWFVVRITGFDFGSTAQNETEKNKSDRVEALPKGGNSAVSGTSKASRNSPPTAVSNKKPPPKKTIKLADLPKQKFRILNQSMMDRVWAVAQPRLVRLKVHRPSGIRNAVGTLVDSRGWILTSFHNIAGATKIEVVESAKKIDNVEDKELLKDEVRGVIAGDPGSDLLLLSINRRFVKSFGNLKTGNRSDVVQGQYVAHAAPPSTDNPYACSEVRVEERLEQASLPDQPAEVLQSIGISDNASSNVWISVEEKKQFIAGSTLFTRDGKLIGLHSFSTGGRCYFLMIDSLDALFAKASEKPKPLSSLFSAEQKAKIQAKEKRKDFGDTALREALENIDTHGAACEKFGWIATSAEDYDVLQKFAKSMSKIQSYRAEHQNDRKQADTIRELKTITKRWVDSFSAGYSENGTHQPSMNKMARLAAEMFNRPVLRDHQQYIPCFGKVFIAGFESPDPEAMFLKIAKTDVYVKTPYQQHGDAMLPGSEWLFFVRRQPTRQTSNHRIKETSLKADAARLMFSLGPLPSTF